MKNFFLLFIVVILSLSVVSALTLPENIQKIIINKNETNRVNKSGAAGFNCGAEEKKQ